MRTKSRIEILESRRLFVSTVFTVDPLQSSLTLIGDFNDTLDNGTVVDSFNAATANYSGELTIDVNPTQLDFTDASLIADNRGATFAPQDLDANYGFANDLTNALEMAIRNLELTMGGTATVSGTDVDLTGVTADALNGNFDSQSAGQAGTADSDLMSSFNWTVSSVTQSTIEVSGGLTTLTLGIDFGFTGTIQGTVGIDLHLQGTIVATNEVVVPSGTISGTVIDDANDSGALDVGETGLAGWTVFADLNANSVLDITDPFAVTNANGTYTIENVPVGTYTVMAVVQSGYSPGGATTGTITNVIVTDGADTPVGDLFFFAPPTTGAITGVIADDQDDDGARDGGEPGLSGWTVFIDGNANNVFDQGERTTTTNAVGTYSFALVQPGLTRVGVVPPEGWRPGGASTGIQSGTVVIGSTITIPTIVYTSTGRHAGTVFNDANENGAKDVGESGVSGWTVFIDTNKNGQFDGGERSTTTAGDGSYAFTALVPGTYPIRVIKFDGWRFTVPRTGSFGSSITPGELESGITFGVTSNIKVFGQVFKDSNDNGKRDSTEIKSGLADWTVFFDTNLDGALSVGETSTITDESGAFEFLNAPAGAQRLTAVAPTGWRFTLPADGFYDLSLTSGLLTGPQYLGLTNFARIWGTVSNDQNDNGKRESGDNRLTGFTVYIDRNSNGKYDAGEATTQSDANGNWAFKKLRAGTYKLGIIPLTGWRQSNAEPIAVQRVATGEIGSSIPFLVTRRNRIVGFVYNDTNKNGKLNSGEVAFPGVRIFLDDDGDGRWDSSERSRITDSAGAFRFTNLPRGAFNVRIEPLSGTTVTAPTSKHYTVSMKYGGLAEFRFALFSSTPIV